MEVPLRLMEWPMVLQCSAIADLSGWCRHMYMWCSVHLASLAPLLCLTYTSLHLHRIWYTPRTVSSSSSLANLCICAVFLFGMWTAVILCFFRSLLILLWMVWWNGIMTVPVDFSFSIYSSTFCCRALL
jgi:hypothetical protein